MTTTATNTTLPSPEQLNWDSKEAQAARRRQSEADHLSRATNLANYWLKVMRRSFDENNKEVGHLTNSELRGGFDWESCKYTDSEVVDAVMVLSESGWKMDWQIRDWWLFKTISAITISRAQANHKPDKQWYEAHI